LFALIGNKVKFEWKDIHNEAFTILQNYLNDLPSLCPFTPGLPIRLECDASNLGVGVVLAQKQNSGDWHPIRYSSKKFDCHQINWNITEKECYAIVWGVSYFNHFIDGSPFEVLTDHIALKWLKSTMRNGNPVPSRLRRWIMQLSPYNFTVIYRKGSDNEIADALSRNPFYDPDNQELPLLVNIIDTESSRIRREQEKDNFCAKTRERLMNGENWNGFFIDEDKVLKRKCIQEEVEYVQVVVPKSCVLDLLKAYHESELGAHFGMNKTFKRMKVKYFWPGMKGQIFNYVRSCDACQRTKADRKKTVGFFSRFGKSQPWERVGLDFIGPLPKDIDENEFIIVCCDYLTKFVIAQAVKECTTRSVINFLKNKVLSVFETPSKIITDQAKCFSSGTFQEFLAKN